MIEVEIPEKDMVVEFPDNTTSDEIEWAIKTNIFNEPVPFDPEGSGFDYGTATQVGSRDPESGHWFSLDPNTGKVLKGRKHETWDLMNEEELKRGSKIIKKEDGRYYSVPQDYIETDPKAIHFPMVSPETLEEGVIDPAVELIKSGIGKGLESLKDLTKKDVPFPKETEGIVSRTPLTPGYFPDEISSAIEKITGGKPSPEQIEKNFGTAVDFWSSYMMTPKEEKDLQKKYPNLMAMRYALSSVLLPGVSEKFASPTELQEFIDKSEDEQRNEILGLAASYMVFGAATKGATSLISAAMRKFPKFGAWMTKDRNLLPESFTKWFKDLSNAKKIKTAESLEDLLNQGFSEGDIFSILRKSKNWEQFNKFKAEGIARRMRVEKPIAGAPPAEPEGPFQPPEVYTGPKEPGPKGPKPPKSEGPTPIERGKMDIESMPGEGGEVIETGTLDLGVKEPKKIGVEKSGLKVVEDGKKEPKQLSEPKSAETFTDPAVRLPDGTVIEGDWTKGGHIAISQELDERGLIGEQEDGVMTSEGRFLLLPKDKQGINYDARYLVGQKVSDYNIPEDKPKPKPSEPESYTQTLSQFLETQKSKVKGDIPKGFENNFKKLHKSSVKAAISEGKIKSHVDYPELNPKPGSKGFATTGPQQPKLKPSKPKKPLITKSQRERMEKQAAIKGAQLNIESAEEAKAAVHEMIRQRRYNLNLATYKTNKFINSIEKVTTKAQQDVIPFVIEKTDVPEALNRPDLIEVYKKDKENLSPIAKQIKTHWDEMWDKIVANTDNLSVDQVENYVTHIWDLTGKNKRDVTNWFITQNKFLKKRYIETLKEGIEKFGLTPKTLNITEIIRIHDSIANRVIENNKFVKALKSLHKDGVPLVERSDKAPLDWVRFYHPALQKAMVIPGKLQMGEKVSPELEDILYEMGVAIGRRINPTAFGKPTKKVGEYKTGPPPEVRFQRFMSNKTIAHEIGHHIDQVLGLGRNFLNDYKTELYAINRERIEASKGEKGKYGEKYTTSPEEQIAEFFATLFTDSPKAYKLAPTATVEVLSRLKKDGVLAKLIDFDFEKNAKNLIEEQTNTLTRVALAVHPDLKKPLKVIFDSRQDGPVINAYEMVNGILKKTKLSISLFHHLALGETGVATMGPIKTGNIYFNPVKIYKALIKGEYDVFVKEPIAMDAVKHGVQFGVTADIPVSMIQGKLNTFARKTKNTLIVNRASQFLKTFNETWDKALWDYLHDTLKLYAYESLSAKIDPAKNTTKQKEEIAQFVNDTFGGQNWDVLMVSPKTLQWMQWSLLSPDWTVSTIRQGLSLTGMGKIHKETASLRRKLGKYFWAKGALYFGVGLNLLNYMFRERDIRNNPQYYKDMDLSFLDKTMWGNTLGKRFRLFVGRHEDGTERYLSVLKQFREVPEYWFDDTGFSPVTATQKKLGGKLAPAVQEVYKGFTGISPSGFKDDDIYGKKGWEKTWGIAKALLKSPFPFSSRAVFQEDREFHLTDITMPSSRGMTRYKSIDFFKVAIETQDESLLKQVYRQTLRNNLPAFTLFLSALTSLKAESTREYNKGIDTIEDVKQEMEKGNLTETEILRLSRKTERLGKEARDRKLGIKALSLAILLAKRYQVKENEKTIKGE